MCTMSKNNEKTGICELLKQQVSRLGTNNTISRYSIMRNELLSIVKKANKTDASLISDAVEVIDAVIAELKIKN